MMKIEDQAALQALVDAAKWIESDHDLCALFKVAKDAAAAEVTKEAEPTSPWVNDGRELPRVTNQLPELRRVARAALRKHIDSAE